MASTAELVVQGIVAVGGTGVLAAIANALMSRAKSKTEAEMGRADAAKVLAEGAAVLVEPLRVEVESLHKQLNEMRGREDQQILSQRARDEYLYRMMRAHSQWDSMVAERLRAAGLEIEEPPPLHLTGA